MTQDPRADGGWFGKLSPSGHHVLTTWIGDYDPALGYRRCASVVDGRVFYVGGYGGGWETDDTVIVYSFPLACLVRWTIGQPGEPTPLTGPTRAGGNALAIANGRHIIGVATPARSYLMWHDGTVIENAGSPALSDDATHLSYLRHSDKALMLDGQVIHAGPCDQVSIGSNTLMCELADGSVLGIADVRNPASVAAPEVFGFRGLRLMKPHAVWVPGIETLCYSCHTDDALIVVRWREPTGWPIARGVLDQGFHDERPLGNDVRIVWSLGGVLQEKTQPLTDAIDVIAAVTPAASQPDMLWTKTTPIDLTAYIIGDDAHWPRSGDHEMDRRWDGTDLFWIKFGDPDHWEHWRLVGDSWFLLEDRSQSGNPGNYSFHPGRWFPRVWTLGGEVKCPDNVIQEYDPKTCTVKAGATRTFPYVLRFKRAWSRITLGGSIGTLTSPDDLPVAVELEYDPGSDHDTRETGLFVRSWGSSRWTLYNQQTGAQLNQTQWMTLGGKRLTPTPGCYRSLETMSARLTITTPFPMSGQAPFEIGIDGKATSGRFDRRFWGWRIKDSGTWSEKEDDWHTTLVFSTPGTYEIRLRGEGPDGPAVTGAQRLVTVAPASAGGGVGAAVSLDQMQALQDTLEAEYAVLHQPSSTYIDQIGRSLWVTEYLKRRNQGLSHAAALAGVVSAIRQAEGREPAPGGGSEPGNGGDPGPAGPDGGPAQVAFPAGLWAAFRAANPITWLNDEPSDAKDDKARKYVEAFVECLCWFLGPQWVVKNAGGTRPKSKDVAAHVGPGYTPGQAFYGFDIFSGVGTNATSVNDNPGGFVITPDQIAFAVTPDRHGVSWNGQGGGQTGGDSEDPPSNVPDLTIVAVQDGRWAQPIVGASMLYAAGPNIDPRAAMDESKALGFRINRFFFGDLPQIGLTQSMALQRMRLVLDWCRERGILAYPSCGTNNDPGRSWYHDCGDILRAYPDVVKISEVVNEARQRGGWASPDKCREYAAELPGLVILTGVDGDGDTSLDYVFNGVYAFHYRRDRSVGDLDSFAQVCQARGLAGFNQEPIGADETNQPGKRSNDVTLFRAMGAANRRLGLAGIFHSEDGLWARPLRPVQRASAIAYLRSSYGQ